MKKILALSTSILLVLILNLSHAQQVQYRAIKKKETSFHAAIDQPIISNYDGSFQLLVSPNIYVIDAAHDLNILIQTKSENYLFTKEFLDIVEENREDNEIKTKVINNNLTLIVLPKTQANQGYKTPFVSKK